MTVSWTPNVDVILGFFDADGSFAVSIYIGKPTLSFYVDLIFSQKTANRDLLDGIIITLDARRKDSSNELLSVSNRITEGKAGQDLSGSSTCISIENPSLMPLLSAWEKNPPYSPTKCLDYYIILLLSSRETPLDVVNCALTEVRHSPITDNRVAFLVLVWLRYQMYGASKGQGKNKIKPIGEIYKEFNATQLEKMHSIKNGQILLYFIQQKVKANNLNIQFSDDRIFGYHLGDGCFTLQITINQTNFKTTFSWQLTENTVNAVFLDKLSLYLETKGIKSTVIRRLSYCRISVQMQDSIQNLIKLWENQIFPAARGKQFTIFKEAFEAYTAADLRTNFDRGLLVIRLKWLLNAESNRKQGSFEEDLEKLKAYYVNLGVSVK